MPTQKMNYQLYFYPQNDLNEKPEFSEGSENLEELKRIAAEFHPTESWFIVDDENELIYKEINP